MNPARITVAARSGAASSPREALAALSLAMLLSSFGTSSANVALPALTEAFGASFQAVQWVVLAYLLAMTTLIVGVGRLGDLIGRRRLLLAGIAFFTAASLVGALAPGLAVLIAARAAQGLGAAVLMALSMALVGASVPKARTGSAMGLLGTMSAVGTALGPALGGVLMAAFDWRAIFLASVPLGLVAFVLARRALPADRLIAAGPIRFDAAGTLLLAATLAAYALAVTVGRGSFGALNLALLIGAAAGAGLFLLVEARAAAPLVALATFREPGFRASLAMNLLVAIVMMATLVVGPFYLARALGLGEALVGLVLASGPVISALTGVLAGRLVDRFGPPGSVIAGLAAMTAGCAALAALPELLGVAGYVAAIAVLTPGYQLFQAANNTAVMANLPEDRRGVVSGVLSLSRNLGLITGAAVMGAVFAFASARSEGAPAEMVATGMQATFIVATGLVAIAATVALGTEVVRASTRRPPAGGSA